MLDGARTHPILVGGAKKPLRLTAIWCLTTMKLGKNTVLVKNFSKQPKISDVISIV